METTINPAQETQNPDDTRTDQTAKTPDDTGQTTDSDGGEFNASAIESQYGMPEGSLKDAKSEHIALQKVREYVDKTLVTGREALDIATTAPPAAAQPKKEETNTKQEGGGEASPEIAALKEEIAALKHGLQQQNEQRQQQLVNTLMMRTESTIDSWNSSKYGKSGQRTYDQIQAVEELKGLVRTHVAGKQVNREPVPVIEVVLNQVRAFHEGPQKSEEQKNTLGAPTTGTRTLPQGGAKNIHEAFANRYNN